MNVTYVKTDVMSSDMHVIMDQNHVETAAARPTSYIISLSLTLNTFLSIQLFCYSRNISKLFK